MSARTYALLFAVVALAPASCSKSEPVASATIDVGTLTSISGDLASLGLEFNDATNLAIEEINAAGGVLGRQLRLVVQDDGTTSEGAKVAFSKLLQARVPVVLGPTSSGQVLGIADQIALGATVTIGRTTTAERLTRLNDNGYFFRVAPSDLYQATLLADLVVRNGVEHLCIVHRRDVYGNDLAASVVARLRASGKNVEVVTSDYDTDNNADLSGVMPKCGAFVCGPSTVDASAGEGGADGGAACNAPEPAKVGLLAITFIEDGARIIDDAQRLGWSAKKQRFFFTDGPYDRNFVALVKDPSNLEGALGTSPAGPDPDSPDGERYRKFVARYKARFEREPAIFAEQAYDTMYAAAIAMEISGSAVPGPAIRDAMGRVSTPGGTKVGAGEWATIRQAIHAGLPIDFEGASGSVDFDENGDIKPPYYYVIWKISGGALGVAERRRLEP
jgi:ABC-type branched-subunit amino acid transport system substrate-binding protein